MASEKKDENAKVVVAEFKVSMHCNACERNVARAIAKVKGVEKFTTDMNKHKVVVTGKIDPLKVLKKLKRKTGKTVEMKVNNGPKDAPDERNSNSSTQSPGAGEVSETPAADSMLSFGWCEEGDALMTIFNDENPNACSIM